MTVALSAKKKALLVKLCRQVPIAPEDQAAAVAWCERMYQSGAAEAPKWLGADPIAATEGPLSNYHPATFRALVDELTDRDKAKCREAAARIKAALKRAFTT